MTRTYPIHLIDVGLIARVDITCPKGTQVHPLHGAPQLDHLQKEKIVFGKGEFRGGNYLHP
jgi:hypothetical protein